MASLAVCVSALAVTLTRCQAREGTGSHTWAVQLLSADMTVARGVATDLGMTVVGRVFNNVFIMNGTNNYVERETFLPKLDHHLILWSERQDGHQRRSGSKREEMGWRKEHSASNRDGSYGRQTRDIGGLDREVPKSPWDKPKQLDPLRWRQWYLEDGDGVHLNVTGLWEAGVRGAGVSVAILDDGVELTHLDLALNYDPAASWDLLDADPDPSPVSWSQHGTQLAGIIAASHSNGICGMGVAPWAGVGAVRMLGYLVWDITEAAALSYERDHVGVYVAAWGPMDTGAVMEGPGVLAARAMKENIVYGRKGRGSIYVWASGNGGLVGDDCNADGYANSLYTLTVSGSTHGGRPPNYAETCAATFVSTYSGDAEEQANDGEEQEQQVNGIVTTSAGGVCTETFRGSSVSAAMVAGVCALALSVNPDLGWRDMQHLMIRAANPHNPLPSQWHVNGAGLRCSYYFGFGSLDAGKMVALARSWRQVPPAFRCYVEAPHREVTLVPDKPVVLPLNVASCQVVQLEHVQVNLSISARNRGQVEIVLESPSGIASTLLPRRPLDLSPYGIHQHPLLTVHMWGEDPRGTWKLRLKYYGDGLLGPFGSKRLINITNTLHNWTLILHGTEVPINQATYQHYYFNATQLSHAHRRKGPMWNTTTTRGMRKPQNPKKYRDNNIRIETQYWNSERTTGNMSLSYLFCKVRDVDPPTVRSLSWQSSDGGAVGGVVRRLRGRGAQSTRYPALLLVREVGIVDGNFTCKVVLYNGKEFSKDVELKDHYSNVPREKQTTQVSVLGGSVKMPCDALIPIVRGTWSHEGHRLRSSGRLVVSEEYLTINNVVKEDLGVYKCHLRSARLNFLQTVTVTLLQAAGPTTLITHYNLTPKSSVPIPQGLPQTTPCTATNSTPLTQDVLSPGVTGIIPRNCPPPYKLLEDHCILVAPGEARSWQRARIQCLRLEGDLLVIKNATFMLALMRHLHTQDLANESFWVGGVVRRGGGEWRWLDGTTLSTSGPLWYAKPRHRPKDMPPTRRHHTSRRKRPASGGRSDVRRNKRRGEGRRSLHFDNTPDGRRSLHSDHIPERRRSIHSDNSPTTSLRQAQVASRSDNEVLAGEPRRAVCLLAKFRHFFSPCSVTDRLTALCQFKASM